ncbi:MAG: DUF4340 domain-containing protein [Chitinispirillaceae bacterium]|nr:DUF4340 domain-containing protein [Chitinispirillaceae bacterium]
MNNKKIIVAAIILGIAVLLLVLVKTLGDRTPSERSLQFFPGITEKSIGAVVLKDATDWVKIQRKGDGWMMVPRAVLHFTAAEKKATGISQVMDADTAAPQKPAGVAAAEYPADSATVASLLDNILKLKKDILVSENPEKQATFEVDTVKGILLEVLDLEGTSRGKVIIGKNASDWSSNYVRSENGTAVYQAQGISRYVFGTDHNRWTDKSIMKFDKAAVTQVALAKKGAPAVILALEGDSVKSWNITQPSRKAADSSKVDELLSGLSNLMASGYEDSSYTDAETGLTDPSLTISVTFNSGAVRTVAFGNVKAGVNKYWIKAQDKPYRYLIDEHEQKRFDKKTDDYQKQELKPIEAVPAKKKTS